MSLSDLPYKSKLIDPAGTQGPGGMFFTPAYRAGNTNGVNMAAIGDTIDGITNYDGGRVSNAMHAGANVQLISLPGLPEPLWLFDGTGGFDFNGGGTGFEAANLPDTITVYAGFVPTIELASINFLFGFNQNGFNNRNFGISFNPTNYLSGSGSKVSTHRATSTASLRQYPTDPYDQCRPGGLAQIEFHHVQSTPSSEIRMGMSEPLAIAAASGDWTTTHAINRFSIGNGNATDVALNKAAEGAAIYYIAIFGGLTDGERAEIRQFLQDETGAIRLLLVGDSIMESIPGRYAGEIVAQKVKPVNTALIANAGDLISDQDTALSNAITTHGNRPTDIAIQVGINDHHTVGVPDPTALFQSMQTLIQRGLDADANIHNLDNYFFKSRTEWTPAHQTAHEIFMHRVRAFCAAQPRACNIDIRSWFAGWEDPYDFDAYWGKDELHPEVWGYEDIQFPAIMKSVISDDLGKYGWQNPNTRKDSMERRNGMLQVTREQAGRAASGV